MKKLIAILAVVLCTTLTVNAQKIETIKCDAWLSSTTCVPGSIVWEHGFGISLYIGDKKAAFYSEQSLIENLPRLKNIEMVRNFDGEWIPVIENSSKNISESNNVTEYTFRSLRQKDKGLVKDFMSGTTTFRKGTEE